ncbi:ABC transporter permease [Sphingobacterium psychroaquaticum]|uniref:ABC transporter permease n=1 Tax=Sphingobacterium psychroaquaticum TaxID=561061 RepID=UPI00106A9ADD|nr:ABC transporter permease [Sphingobacterium psychroaquaticum]QBQ41361.1 ABC transporter permease [Sphingobacterium psychroaquaticum]
MLKIIKYVISDILRSRTIIAYMVLLLALAFSVLGMESNAEKGIVSLLNIVLFVVPLVSIIFATVYLYNSAEFIELLVSQPLKRTKIWGSIFLGLSGAITLAFLIGVGIPIIIFAWIPSGILLLVCGAGLSAIFVSIALWTAVQIRDKAKGIGLAILLWLYFALLFDALVLFLMFQFSDYPIENGMVALTMLNPIDITRIIILLEVDLSAMMGYTGAIFQNFFGTGGGMILTAIILLLWITLPFLFSTLNFKKKDL